MYAKSITIVKQRSGTDIIYVETNLPPAMWPWKETDYLTMRFEAAKGTGESYVKTNFQGIPIEVVSDYPCANAALPESQ